MKALLTLTFAGLFAACSISVSSDGNSWQDRKVKGNGVSAKEKRTISNEVDRIIITSSIDVEYTQGSPASMEVQGDENLIEKVVTEVSGNTLKVYRENGNYWMQSTKGLKVIVTTPHLSEVAVSSSGDFEATNPLTDDAIQLKTSSSGDIQASVETDDLKLYCSSSGDIHIKGSADRLLARTSSSGDIKGKNLKTRLAELATSSSGDVYVYASDAVKARTSSSGDIHVYGSPDKRDTSESSSGDIYID
ncbi:MAG: DUF2807 domain-containing protein [Saprospiraceae bacterium]|nr:DUF2807 domain-containing protein [Saprospiraceae bacterium]